jgi:hypothetical protein
MAKIENVQFIIPVPNQSYTDIRPTISGEDWDDIRTTAMKLAEGVGNLKLSQVLSGQEKRQEQPLTSSQRIIGDGVLFDEAEHTYSKGGKQYLSGSTFAHLFEKEFPRDAIAQKVASKNGKEPDEVLKGWDSKGEISLQYGTLIHKCIETWCVFGEKPNNAYLQTIVDDWDEVFKDDPIDFNELFVQDDAHRLCGIIDGLGGNTIYDWKTGDIHQKIQHTLEGFPNDRLSLYTLQLNFYKYIVEQNGGRVDNLVIGWLNGEHWEKVKVDIIDIVPYLKKATEELWKPNK